MQMIMYANLYVPTRQDYEGMYVNLTLREQSSGAGHSNNGLSEQRRVRSPVAGTVRCPILSRQRCHSSMSATCLAALCLMLLIIIGLLSAINANLRSSCLNQSAVPVPTSAHLQLYNSSLTDTR